jgi:hypothetical protein
MSEQTADLNLHGTGAKARRSMVFYRGTDRVGQIFGEHAQLQTLRALWLSGANFAAVIAQAEKMGIEL